jgi:hypothetical protein
MRDIDRESEDGDRARGWLAIGWVLWKVISWPVLALLIVLEPVFALVLSGFALLGTLTAFFLRFTSHIPNSSFWMILGVSLGSFGLLSLYYALIRVLGGSSRGV